MSVRARASDNVVPALCYSVITAGDIHWKFTLLVNGSFAKLRGRIWYQRVTGDELDEDVGHAQAPQGWDSYQQQLRRAAALTNDADTVLDDVAGKYDPEAHQLQFKSRAHGRHAVIDEANPSENNGGRDSARGSGAASGSDGAASSMERSGSRSVNPMMSLATRQLTCKRRNVVVTVDDSTWLHGVLTVRERHFPRLSATESDAPTDGTAEASPMPRPGDHYDLSGAVSTPRVPSRSGELSWGSPGRAASVLSSTGGRSVGGDAAGRPTADSLGSGGDDEALNEAVAAAAHDAVMNAMELSLGSTLDSPADPRGAAAATDADDAADDAAAGDATPSSGASGAGAADGEAGDRATRDADGEFEYFDVGDDSEGEADMRQTQDVAKRNWSTHWRMVQAAATMITALARGWMGRRRCLLRIRLAVYEEQGAEAAQQGEAAAVAAVESAAHADCAPTLADAEEAAAAAEAAAERAQKARLVAEQAEEHIVELLQQQPWYAREGGAGASAGGATPGKLSPHAVLSTRLRRQAGAMAQQAQRQAQLARDAVNRRAEAEAKAKTCAAQAKDAQTAAQAAQQAARAAESAAEAKHDAEVAQECADRAAAAAAAALHASESASTVVAARARTQAEESAALAAMAAEAAVSDARALSVWEAEEHDARETAAMQAAKGSSAGAPTNPGGDDDGDDEDVATPKASQDAAAALANAVAAKASSPVVHSSNVDDANPCTPLSGDGSNAGGDGNGAGAAGAGAATAATAASSAPRGGLSGLDLGFSDSSDEDAPAAAPAPSDADQTSQHGSTRSSPFGGAALMPSPADDSTAAGMSGLPQPPALSIPPVTGAESAALVQDDQFTQGHDATARDQAGAACRLAEQAAQHAATAEASADLHAALDALADARDALEQANSAEQRSWQSAMYAETPRASSAHDAAAKAVKQAREFVDRVDALVRARVPADTAAQVDGAGASATSASLALGVGTSSVGASESGASGDDTARFRVPLPSARRRRCVCGCGCGWWCGCGCREHCVMLCFRVSQRPRLRHGVHHRDRRRLRRLVWQLLLWQLLLWQLLGQWL